MLALPTRLASWHVAARRELLEGCRGGPEMGTMMTDVQQASRHSHASHYQQMH